MQRQYKYRAILRRALADEAGLTERQMFSGLAFLVEDHMVCGLLDGGGMFRVGPQGAVVALMIPGVSPMQITGRSVPGLVATTSEVLDDATQRGALLELALAFVRSLPPRDAEAWPSVAGAAR
jgi:TfoX N-terminal domain